LLHNPVFLPADVASFARLCSERNLAEQEKTESRDAIRGRIELLHEVIEAGLSVLSKRSPDKDCDTEA
jgi:hypothetical protein